MVASPLRAAPDHSLPGSLCKIVSSGGDDVCQSTSTATSTGSDAAKSLPRNDIVLEHATDFSKIETLASKKLVAIRPTVSYFSAAVSAVRSLFHAPGTKSEPSAQAAGADTASSHHASKEHSAVAVAGASSSASRHHLIDSIMSPACTNTSIDLESMHIDLGPESQTALAATRSLARSTRWLLPPRWHTSLCWAEKAAWLGEASVKLSARSTSFSYRLCVESTIAAHSTIRVASSASHIESPASDAELLRFFLCRSSFCPGDLLRGHIDMRESEFPIYSLSVSLESVETLCFTGSGPVRVKTKTWSRAEVYSPHSCLFPFQFALPDGDSSAAAFASELIKLSWRLRFNFSVGPRSRDEGTCAIATSPYCTNQSSALEWVLPIPIRHDKTKLDGIQAAGHRAIARGVGPFS